MEIKKSTDYFQGKIKIVPAREIVYGNMQKKQVIFTFDGGSGIASLKQVINVLKQHHVKGSFFLTGQFIEKYPNEVKDIVANGNEIFNHTYSHPYLTTISNEEIKKELDKMDDILYSITKTRSGPYYRAPYGDRDRRVNAVAVENGYQPVYWSDDALDWEEPLGMTREEVKERIINSLAPGKIFLMHIGDNITGQILDETFTIIENDGYKIVSLTEGI